MIFGLQNVFFAALRQGLIGRSYKTQVGEPRGTLSDKSDLFSDVGYVSIRNVRAGGNYAKKGSP